MGGSWCLIGPRGCLRMGGTWAARARSARPIRERAAFLALDASTSRSMRALRFTRARHDNGGGHADSPQEEGGQDALRPARPKRFGGALRKLILGQNLDTCSKL